MKIGIICAMDEECEFFLEKFAKYETKNIGKVIVYEGQTEDGHEIILSRSGIGKVSAGAVAGILIAVYGVNYIINSGIAGSMSKELKIEDLVISTAASNHDADYTAFGYAVGQIAQQPVQFNASPELIAKADIAASTIPSIKDKIHKGLIVSGDEFVNSPERKNEILAHFPNAYAVECEGAAIAQIASSFNVPFLIIRSISDSADENEVTTYELNVKQASENSARLVLGIIKML